MGDEYRRGVGFLVFVCFLIQTGFRQKPPFKSEMKEIKGRDMNPAWRSHHTQGKRAAGAEVKEQIILAAI